MTGAERRGEPTPPWQTTLLIVVTALSVVTIFVPFWLGMAGLAWANAHELEFTIAAGVSVVVFFSCLWASSKVSWPRELDAAPSRPPGVKYVPLPRMIMSSLTMTAAVYLQVSAALGFLSELISTVEFAPAIVGVLASAGTALALSAAVLAWPRLLMTDTMRAFHGLPPDTSY